MHASVSVVDIGVARQRHLPMPVTDRACDRLDPPPGERSTAPGVSGTPTAAAGPPACILIAEADPALRGLLEEWLLEHGCRPVRAGAGRQGDGGIDLVIVDVPFPRQGGADIVHRIAAVHPDTPILALSSAFFAGVERSGAVARALGVAAVLPKPVQRDALLAAVGKLVRAP